ncbi:MAG: ABC transporter permease [Malacoplasma sp.]
MKPSNKQIKKITHFVSTTADKNNIAIFNLINKFFWKSKLALISMFGLPLLFIVIYYAVASSRGSSFKVTDGFNLYIGFSVMPIALVSLPQLLVELKNSIILRRIAISNISPFRYNFLMSVYFFAMCVISTIFIFIAVSAFENVNMKTFLDSFDIPSYIYALINFYVVSISFGIILSSISKSSSWVQLVGLAIILFSLMLSGQFIPIHVISNIMPIKIISLFSPLDYALGLMNNVIMAGQIKSFITAADYIVAQVDAVLPNLPPDAPLPIPQDILDKLRHIRDLLPAGGYNIFDLTQPFVLPNFSLLKGLGPESSLVGRTLYYPIYEIWQKSLNIVFPYVFLIGSTYLSVNRFSWSSR